MKYVIRIKVVSECMRIRRSKLLYLKNIDNIYDLTKLEHPLNKFKKINILNNHIIINNDDKELKVGEEDFYYITNDVVSLNTTLKERITLGFMLIPLDKEMIPFYNKKIDENSLFDQWNGEFEYLIGLMYDLCENDSLKANEYYNKALDKGFKVDFL